MTIKINKPSYGNVFASADTFDELRGIRTTVISDGYNAIVSGATSRTDGNGGLFLWNPTSTAADDDFNIIAPDDGGNGRWHRSGQLGPTGAVGPQGAGLADVMAPGGAALVGYTPNGAGAVARTLLAKIGELALSPEDFGAVGDGANDDAPAIRLMIAAAVARATSNRMVSVKLTPGKRYKCNSSFTVPVDKVQFDGGGCTLDFSALAKNGTYAVLLNASIYPPWYQPGRYFGNVHLTGPLTSPDSPLISNTCVGLLVRSDNDGGPSHLAIGDVQMESFGVGIQFGQHAYIITLYDADFWSCGVCVDMLNEADCGENIRFVGGVLYNSDLAVRMSNPNAEINFIGASIDYNKQVGITVGGRILLNNCHLEFGDSTLRQFVISGNGGGVQIEGGARVVTGPKPHSFDYWVDCTAPGFYYENNLFATNDRTSTNAFAIGTGSIQRGRLNGYDIYENCQKTHATNSDLVDPGFINTAVLDNIFVSPTGGDFIVGSRTTESHSAAGVITTLVTDTGRLKYSKGGGAGFSSVWWILIPVNKNDLAAAFLNYSKPGTGAGTVYFSSLYVRLNPVSPVSTKVPEVVPIQTIGSLQVDFTSAAASSSIGFVGQSTTRCPSGATHFGIQVNAINMGIADIYITAPHMGVIM